MQTIDVLGDQSDQLFLDAERLDEIMADVGLGIFVLFPAVEATLPGFDARGFTAHVLLKGHRPVARPDSARTAEIRYPRLGADAGAGEDDDLIALANSGGKFIKLDHGHLIKQSTVG